MISIGMWKKRAIAVLAVAVMISLSLNVGLLLASRPVSPASYTEITVTGYDAQGHVIATRHQVGDYLLVNFAAWYMCALQGSYNGIGTYPLNITDMYHNAQNYVESFPMMYSYGYGNGLPWGWIAVGNDSAATSPTDWNLTKTAGTTMLGVARAASSMISISGNQMNLSISGSVVLASGGSVTVAGLVSSASQIMFSMSNSVLLTRDVFSAVTVPVGGAIAIQLTMVVNA